MLPVFAALQADHEFTSRLSKSTEAPAEPSEPLPPAPQPSELIVASLPSQPPEREEVVIPRAGHPISRKNIAEGALWVMQRLNQSKFKAYLVGGAVRDLYLEKEPKDYDIATDAEPGELKKLFRRNCRIIGRRFEIAHVFYRDGRVLEVSTFRCSPSDTTTTSQDHLRKSPADASEPRGNRRRGGRHGHRGIVRAKSGIILQDNEYGSPVEDARRRDLTINGLFYDLETFSVLDYVGGVEDLKNGIVRMISDPDLSFREDPVRMIRALRHATRTGFRIEAATLAAIHRNPANILKANPSRLLEEMLKDLRGGAAAPYFTALVETHVLDTLLPVLAKQLRDHGPDHPFWRRIRRLDTRIRDGQTPTTAVLLSILLHTVLFDDTALWTGGRPNPPNIWKHISQNSRSNTAAMRVSRRDTERIFQIVIAFLKLHRDLARSRLEKSIVHKTYFREALDFLEIDLESQGLSNPLTEKWRQQAEDAARQVDKERRRTHAGATREPGGNARAEDPERAANGKTGGPRRRRRRRGPRKGPRAG